MRVVEQVGGAFRKIDQPVVRIGPAIVDADDDGAAVLNVGDARVARQRHGRMRRRQMRHVVDFAIGGEPAMEGVAVPGGQTRLLVVLVFLGIVHLAAHLVGLAESGRGRRRASGSICLMVTRGLAFTPYSASEKYSLERFLMFTIPLGCEEAQAARKPAATAKTAMVVALRRRERARNLHVQDCPLTNSQSAAAIPRPAAPHYAREVISSRLSDYVGNRARMWRPAPSTACGCAELRRDELRHESVTSKAAASVYVTETDGVTGRTTRR